MKRRSIFATVAALFCGRGVVAVEAPELGPSYKMSEIDKLWLKESERVLKEWDRQTQLRLERQKVQATLDGIPPYTTR